MPRLFLPGVMVCFFPSQFFPGGKNRPADSFPGEKTDKSILSPGEKTDWREIPACYTGLVKNKNKIMYRTFFVCF